MPEATAALQAAVSPYLDIPPPYLVAKELHE